MEVRTFLNYRDCPASSRWPPVVLSCATGGFSSLTYMLLNIHSARIGIRSHGIRYSIYVKRVF